VYEKAKLLFAQRKRTGNPIDRFGYRYRCCPCSPGVKRISLAQVFQIKKAPTEISVDAFF
jgi:hypothetical protein